MCLQKRINKLSFKFIKQLLFCKTGYKILSYDNERLMSVHHPEDFPLNVWKKAINEWTGWESFRYPSGYHIYINKEELGIALESYKKYTNSLVVVEVKYKGLIEVGLEEHGVLVFVVDNLVPTKVLKIIEA